ncbi:hypothetical protein [Luteimonas terrae]|uniref:Uncharacterized protein n=1 Tax=Luteimonas terrae TaxID=1530191 RepID=A0ABU1XWT0_9GAMM|nr:hypothetical protein [Luteimonas terrae]MDR7193217.1 hypothetical protein [Luteimonas terrae]
MSRTKTPSPPQSDTRHLFAGARKPNERGASLTSDRIADDLASFRKSGGKIEVLGNTRTLTRIDGPAVPPPVEAAPRKRRAG